MTVYCLMYYYIYDQFLGHKKYDKIIAQIESKITDLGIKDKIFKMSVLKSFAESVEDAIKKEAENIIVVGNDQTVNQVANLIAGTEIALGIIPLINTERQPNLKIRGAVNDDNTIAYFFGVDDPLEACEIISARKIELINLGEINNTYFLNSIKVYDHHLKIECDGKFAVSPLTANNLVGIYNFLPETPGTPMGQRNKKFFNPQDNFLEVVIEPENKKTLAKMLKKWTGQAVEAGPLPSIFRVKRIAIKNPPVASGSVLVDNFRVLKTPLNIKISDKKLKVIVGKNRKF